MEALHTKQVISNITKHSYKVLIFEKVQNDSNF